MSYIVQSSDKDNIEIERVDKEITKVKKNIKSVEEDIKKVEELITQGTEKLNDPSLTDEDKTYWRQEQYFIWEKKKHLLQLKSCLSKEMSVLIDDKTTLERSSNAQIKAQYNYGIFNI